jgi:hypothetical protein
LYSTQEEADTRMILQALQGHSSWIDKNLRPFLTLLTFPIWTHSSLVFVICLSK